MMPARRYSNCGCEARELVLGEHPGEFPRQLTGLRGLGRPV
jgi:hypothetical protein